MMNSLKKYAKCALAASTLALLMSSVGVAETSVYVQFGDGRVVRSTRGYYTRHWANQGGVIINALPAGYVSEPYSYTGGYPVYYQETYWTRHHRSWHHHGHHHHHHHHHH
jgi:hypothetical protein